MATSGPESGSGGSGIAAMESSAAMNSRAPKLVRARSGPATLSHAVFEMLYVELRSVLGGLRKARAGRARERARARATKANVARKAAAAAAAAAADAAAAAATAAAAAEAAAEAAAATAAGATETAEGKEGQEKGVEETTAPQESTGGVEALADGHGAAAAAAPDVAATHASETTASGGGGGGGSVGGGDGRRDEVEEEEEGDTKVLERLADMRDDMACLTLSRELQVSWSIWPRVAEERGGSAFSLIALRWSGMCWVWHIWVSVT